MIHCVAFLLNLANSNVPTINLKVRAWRFENKQSRFETVFNNLGMIINAHY